MTTLALLLVFPLVWPFVAKILWKHQITLAELGLNLLVGAIVVSLGWAAGRYGQMLDVEIWNGQVTGKYSERVSCSHSYRCNCVTTCSGSGANRTCSESCSTCYDHSYDVNWRLRTTVGELTVDRVDRQGVKEPPRYAQARDGDPVAKAEKYQNYIKAAPDSLFNSLANRQLMEQFAGKLPSYPSSVRDVHYVDRVLAVGFALPEQALWNHELALALRTLGPAKEVNTVLVFTKEADPQFAAALDAAWLGGKKNDVVVVLGAPDFPAIAWARVLSWTDREVFKVQLRDALLDLKTIERRAVLDTVTSHIARGFQRRPMQDFAYLKDQIEPPAWVLVVLFALSALTSIGLSVYLANNELVGEGRFLSRSRRRYNFR
jgi:hypothetical protein